MSDTDKQTDQPKDPRGGYHSGPFPEQEQKQPGLTAPMDPKPDHGELSYGGTESSRARPPSSRAAIRNRQGRRHRLRP